MEPPVVDGDAVLVIRVWFEPDHRNGFRARLLGLHPDEGGGTVLSSPEAVADAVGSWLADLRRGSR